MFLLLLVSMLLLSASFLIISIIRDILD